MIYRIYKKDELVAEGESPLTIKGLTPGQTIRKGTYQICTLQNGLESERVDLQVLKRRKRLVSNC